MAGTILIDRPLASWDVSPPIQATASHKGYKLSIKTTTSKPPCEWKVRRSWGEDLRYYVEITGSEDTFTEAQVRAEHAAECLAKGFGDT